MTDRRMSTLRAIHSHVESIGIPPSRREIAERIGLKSPGDVQRIIAELESQGLIQVFPGSSRGLRITDSGMKALVEEL